MTTENRDLTTAKERSEEMLRSVASIGTLWARYGLSVGKAVLETSASTLKTTAGLLGDIAERLNAQNGDRTK